MGLVKEFFSEDDREQILSAIRQAERNTSGEIRVRVERFSGSDIIKKAKIAFKDIGMHRTKKRNGILFYFAIYDRQFAVFGDDGIHKVVPATFWDDIRDLMQTYFINDCFAKGLSEGIKLCGFMLGKYFPYKRNDVNELPNAISFEEESESII